MIILMVITLVISSTVSYNDAHIHDNAGDGRVDDEGVDNWRRILSRVCFQSVQLLSQAYFWL